MKFIFITNRAEIAAFAIKGGVDLIMVDLEIVGKADRQGHLDTLISKHSVADIGSVRASVPAGCLMVRSDPLHHATAAQVDAIVAAGADLIMLPYFRSLGEVEEFSRIVDRRADIVLLAETSESRHILRECSAVPGVVRIHIGLNDLSIDLGKRFMFELLVDGTVDAMAADLRASAMPFGIGGVARVDEGLVPARDVLAQHVALRSDAAILSRTFHRNAETVADIEADMDFAAEVSLLRASYRDAQAMTSSARQRIIDAMRDVVNRQAMTMSQRSRLPEERQQ